MAESDQLGCSVPSSPRRASSGNEDPSFVKEEQTFQKENSRGNATGCPEGGQKMYETRRIYQSTLRGLTWIKAKGSETPLEASKENRLREVRGV